MKPFRHILFCLQLLLAASFFQLAATATAANTGVTPPPAGKTNAVAATNSAPVELTVPHSVFDLTEKPTKDPFFPLSLRQPVQATTNAAPAFSAGAFTLKGLSGSAERRLALINNRTVAPGEFAEITTPSGKIKIYCIDVREASVLIRAEAQTEPVEIFLRKSAQ